jgi:hypothetical protein
MDHTIGIDTLLHCWDAKRLYTKTATHVGHGHQKELTVGILGHQWTTTDAASSFFPETQAYCISGSAELFPQHSQIPNMSPHLHLLALTDELWDTTAVAASTSKGRRLLKLLQSNLQNILNPPVSTTTPRTEQRVTKEQQRCGRKNKG